MKEHWVFVCRGMLLQMQRANPVVCQTLQLVLQ